MVLNPDSASPDDLGRDLGRLQRRHRVATHEVGERDVRPDAGATIDPTAALGIVVDDDQPDD